jgi:hypothetical protein
MTITIIIAATPNITVPVDARPVGGEAVGAGVGGALITAKEVSALDGQYPLVPENVAYTVKLPGMTGVQVRV